MKLFIVSDIHGSLHYTKKVLEAYEKANADYLVILGDLLYHGARNPLPLEYNPKEVAKLLNTFSDRIIAVKGNCDSEVDQMVLDFPITAPYSTILYNGMRLFLTHGHIHNEQNMPKLSDHDVFMYGHTHIPVAVKAGNIFVVNPGSVTLPKENNPNTYAVLEEKVIRIMDFEGNVFKELFLL